MEELSTLRKDFVLLSRLAANGQSEDVRMFLAKAVRKYRRLDPEMALEVDSFLRSSRPAVLAQSPLRRDARGNAREAPVDVDFRASLLRHFDDDADIVRPVLSAALKSQVETILRERKRASVLAKHGLKPTRSALLIGAPGVGKTLTARWIASELKERLWVLDLSSVMSSLLGKSGGNIRSALEYVKERQGVLLLDEIDAIAKHRNDESDVGELKRLVVVLLQEIDAWPETGLLLAATNHPELIDRALWRRFDAVIDFALPDEDAIRQAIERFAGPDAATIREFAGTLAILFRGSSLADVERWIKHIRRAMLIDAIGAEHAVLSVAHDRLKKMPTVQRREVALELARSGTNYHEIQRVTGVARDTVRRHVGPSKTPRGRR